MIGKIVTSAAIYLMIWWVTLFAVLPIGGNQSPHEAGTETQKGNDPGAPIVHQIGKKMRLNSLVALGFWAIVMLLMYVIHIPLPEIH
ncbi:DUF1467 family protein [Asticcacaulis sp. EMRT-3]|uniref:DUF1467 family protein n=1 Tax=Asticcacaulis sp. EMRT-3 TaxID=3040349 RepID=UPI0024AF98E0|nr:DUF1467 family protein [Asticcacaulis sp. EMRT-3]MDI7774854.1 DUF1467 family protein [Asticcacaulis sp. EMRT-3]